MKKANTPVIGEFEKGIAWNYIATGLMALNGFVCNFIIAYFYNAEAVGLYNRIYSYYLVLSQISVFGIHMSVGQSVPKEEKKSERLQELLSSALLLTLIVSGIVIIAIRCVLNVTENLIGYSNYVAMGNILGALVLFSINKVIIFFFNGLSMMKEYAWLQSMRYIVLGVSVFVQALMKIPVENLVICFLIAEIAVVILGLVILAKCKFRLTKIKKQDIIKHFDFGKKIFLSNLVLDLNTKVDIISLGFLLGDDYYIGIYSFAVMFIEGFYQVLVVIRRSINPKITQFYYGIEKCKDSFFRAYKLTSWTAWITYVGILVGYFCICFIMGDGEYFYGLLPIAIIGISILITKKQILYGNIFSQIGKPELETKVNIITVGSNILFNIVLIPLWGINGAALATSISYIAFAIVLKRCYSNEPRIMDII